DPNLLGRDLFDRVGFVENNKIVWKQKTALAAFLFVWRTEQDEEQRVIEHDHVRGEQSFAGLVIKTARILSAGFLRTDVCFAANLRPNFRVGLDRNVAERTVTGLARPLGDSLEFVGFRPGK